MLDSRIFHQDTLKKIPMATVDLVTVPQTMLDEAQGLADTHHKLYFVSAKYEPNPDFKGEGLRGVLLDALTNVLTPNTAAPGRLRLSGHFAIGDDREEMKFAGFHDMVWVKPGLHLARAERPAVFGGDKSFGRPGAQWKVTLIVNHQPAGITLSGEEVYAAAAKHFLRRHAEDRIGIPVEKGGHLRISDVMEVEEYKPINRNPEDAA